MGRLTQTFGGETIPSFSTKEELLESINALKNNLKPKKNRTIKEWLSLSGIEKMQRNKNTRVRTSFTVPLHITELPGCDCKREKKNFPFVVKVNEEGNVEHNCNNFSYYNKKDLVNNKARKKDGLYNSYYFSHF